jgi:uncharacterized protein with FMN-binding domain
MASPPTACNSRVVARLSIRRIAAATPAALGLAGCGHTAVAPSGQPASVAQPPAGSSSAALKSGSYDGQVVQTRYGPVQVAVTVGGRKLTAITFLAVPVDRPRSQQISAQAEPFLRSEALAAQSAQVNLLSGATYTSEGFAQSLQSALSLAR